MESLVPCSLHWWVGGSNNRSIADCIPGSKKNYQHDGQKLAEKENLGLKYNPFLHNCTLAKNYIHIIASHENKHPVLAANFEIGIGA